MKPHVFYPKLITVFREGYSLHTFTRDLWAGVIVGIVAIPLSIALAIASGVKPEQGLYTACIAGFLIALLGGSRVQIGGPTGAFVVIVFGIVSQYGYDGLAAATIMAGGLLIALGVAGLGSAIKFIPYPVTVGFTSGIAIIILCSQVRDFLGLRAGPLPAHVIEQVHFYTAHLGETDIASVLLAAACLFILFAWPRITASVPAPLVVIVLASACVPLLGLDVETIGSRFGEIPAGLPRFRLPQIDLHSLPSLVQPAMAIALLAGIESLLSAVVADGMTGGRHRSNTELIAQGAANIVSPLFGGIPATGAIARTATNIKSGGTTPVAGIIHALFVLLILVFLGRYAVHIPMPALAAILVKVAWNMGEWHMFARLLKSPPSDVMVLLSTFALTVLVDLVAAIEVGMVLAAFLFMRRMADVTTVANLRIGRDQSDEEEGSPAPVPDIPEGVEVFEISGPFFFGAAQRFRDALDQVKATPRVLILRMRYVPIMDATAVRALEELVRRSITSGSIVVLSGVAPPLLQVLQRSGLAKTIGSGNIFSGFSQALRHAENLAAEETVTTPGEFPPNC